MNLKTKKLDPPAVQWTVFDKDPVPGFRSRVKRMKGYYSERLERAEGNTAKEIARFSGMMVSWDLGFEEVNGDKVYLLTRAPKNSHAYSSNAPDGKKWFVTRTRQIKGKPVCWCIPFTAETGKKINIVLTEDNLFDLESEFDKVMGEDE